MTKNIFLNYIKECFKPFDIKLNIAFFLGSVLFSLHYANFIILLFCCYISVVLLYPLSCLLSVKKKNIIHFFDIILILFLNFGALFWVFRIESIINKIVFLIFLGLLLLFIFQKLVNLNLQKYIYLLRSCNLSILLIFCICFSSFKIYGLTSLTSIYNFVFVTYSLFFFFLYLFKKTPKWSILNKTSKREALSINKYNALITTLITYLYLSCISYILLIIKVILTILYS